MTLAQRAGAVERMEIDLRVIDEPVTENEFLEHAATIQGTYTSDGTLDYSRDSAEAWMAAATSLPE